MTEDQFINILALQNVPKIGSTTAKKLIVHCGNVEAVFKEKKSNILKIDGIGTVTIEGLFDNIYFKEAVNELRFINTIIFVIRVFRL